MKADSDAVRDPYRVMIFGRGWDGRDLGDHPPAEFELVGVRAYSEEKHGRTPAS